jgi:pSer/pThr/pTyr-binding forkhead associated (FHA) protein
MEVKLVVIGGSRSGMEIPVRGPKFFVGRAEDCHLRPQSELVSRHHCAILLEDGFVSIRDFGSRNGTLVNGEAVSGERELKSGDRLKIGPLELDVQITVPLAAKKKPKVHNIHEAAARTVQNSANTKEEDEIADWLGDDTTPPSASLSDTKSISATLTTAFTPTSPVSAAARDTAKPAVAREKAKPAAAPEAAKPAATPEAAKPAAAPVPAAAKPAAPAPYVPPPHTPAAKPKKPSKPEKQSTAQDTGAAADAVLRQFFGRKR